MTTEEDPVRPYLPPPHPADGLSIFVLLVLVVTVAAFFLADCVATFGP